MKKGESYVVVPSAMKPGDTGEFYLSIYLSCELHDIRIQRVGKHERYSFIAEEYEKSLRSVPDWKMRYVKEIVKTPGAIIMKNDEQQPSNKKMLTRTMTRKATKN